MEFNCIMTSLMFAVKFPCLQVWCWQYWVNTMQMVNWWPDYGGWSVPKCWTFSGRWICILLFITGDNFYIQINYNTFGMTNSISKWRDTFGMTNSISKWRDTFGMINSISKCRSTFGMAKFYKHGDLWPAKVMMCVIWNYICPVVYLVCYRELWVTWEWTMIEGGYQLHLSVE